MGAGKMKKPKAKGEGKLAAAQTKRAAAAGGKALRDYGEAMAEQARSDLDQRAEQALKKAKKTDAYAKGAEFAEKAKDRLEESGLDERAKELARQARESDLAKQIRESETTQQAREALQRFSDEQLERLGERLVGSKAGKRLGVKKKHRARALLVLVLGLGAGWALGVLTAPKRGEELRRELAEQTGAGELLAR